MRRRDVLAALAALAAPGLRAHDGSHAPPRPGYSRTTARYVLPEAPLVDMHGRPYDLRADLSRPGVALLNFVFTSCTAICPLMTATFAQVQKGLGRDAGAVRLVSVSVDPEHDTPARLREYAARFGAGPGWRFVTGTREASITVQRAFDVYRGDKMNHDPVAFLRAAPGGAWLRLEGFASAAELLAEYRRVAHG